MTSANPPADVTFQSFQKLIREMYFEKDQARGIPASFLWLSEEIGELASALRETDPSEKARIPADEFKSRRENLAAEFADVAEIDLSEAVHKKYGSGCPGCQQFICQCPDSEKP